MGFSPRSFFRTFTLICVAMNTIAASAQERLPLQSGWAIQSSAKVQDTGDVISSAKFQATAWTPISVPTCAHCRA